MNLENAKMIWCAQKEPNTYCYARRKFNIENIPKKATMFLFADSRYNCWVNGYYIGQGPTPFRKPYIYFDSFDVTSLLQRGENVITILGNYHGVAHCTYTLGQPGILAQIDLVDAQGRFCSVQTDQQWKALAPGAFVIDVPRRNGATGWMEYFDASKEPTGWHEIDYDDSYWPDAQVCSASPLQLQSRVVPYLNEYSISSDSIMTSWNIQNQMPCLEELTRQMDNEQLIPIDTKSKFPLVIEGAPDGYAFAVDFGQEIVGQIEIDVDAPAGVTIDLCAAENLRDDGRPWCFRKGSRYAKRYQTRQGRQYWRSFGYDGVRFIHVVIRGPHPKLVFHRLGFLRREAALPTRAIFECDNPVVNRIWEITCHTMRIGSQDVHVDCPTREQTSAWGDHIWSGLWELYMTGDSSHLRHLLLSIEHCQRPDGQIPAYAFSGEDYPLYDYSLIAIIGIWLYIQHTGDQDLPKHLIPAADRILNWYRNRIGQSGLIEVDGQEDFDAAIGQIFIDHPGLGFHNCSHPPIDRKGINAALNFFYIMALDAYSSTHTYLGNNVQADQLRSEANAFRSCAHDMFFESGQTAYVDAVYLGNKSKRISQQTNALAVLSETCSGDCAQQVLQRVLDLNDPTVCLCGTYFWTYLSAAMCQSGMHVQMWHEIIRLWDEMAQKGATSWWETFLGDELDSLCHIWSCIPGYLILAEVLGVKPTRKSSFEIRICPQVELLDRVSGSVPILNGNIAVNWSKLSRSTVLLEIKNSTLSPVLVELPPSWSLEENCKTTAKVLSSNSALKQTIYKKIEQLL